MLDAIIIEYVGDTTTPVVGEGKAGGGRINPSNPNTRSSVIANLDFDAQENVVPCIRAARLPYARGSLLTPKSVDLRQELIS